jgi:hypothetical protein
MVAFCGLREGEPLSAPLHTTLSIPRLPALAVLGALSGSYSKVLEIEQRRWALLRSIFILRREHSWLGSCLKHRQLNISSRDRYSGYACLRTSRTTAYLGFPLAATKEIAASKHRHVSAYFLAAVVPRSFLESSASLWKSAHQPQDDESSRIDSQLDVPLAQLQEALLRIVRKQDAAKRKNHQMLSSLIQHQRTLATQTKMDGSKQARMSPMDGESGEQDSNHASDEGCKRVDSESESLRELRIAEGRGERHDQAAGMGTVAGKWEVNEECGTSDSSFRLPPIPSQSRCDEEGWLRSQGDRDSAAFVSSCISHSSRASLSRGRGTHPDVTPAQASFWGQAADAPSSHVASFGDQSVHFSRDICSSRSTYLTATPAPYPSSSHYQNKHMCAGSLSDGPDQIVSHLRPSTDPLRSFIEGGERRLSSLHPEASCLASTQNAYLAMSGSISEELIHAKDNYNRALQAARAVADSMQIEAEPPLTPISLSHKWALFDREAVRSQHESDLRI